MGKYIIEVDDKYVSPDNKLIVSHKNLFDGDSYSYHIQIAKLTPYTEDLEHVRKEAFEKGYSTAVAEQECAVGGAAEKGYQKGLSDVWDAIRKVNDMILEEQGKVFKTVTIRDIIRKYSASEIIEKLRQYEQEKKEQIQVGDEIKSVSGKAVVTGLSPDNEHVRYVYFDGSTGVIHKSTVSRTGRHYPEIAEVLRKMKENSDG